MKNILLLTDFSENANNAIHYALHFFKNEKCTFHLMHVHKISGYTSSDLLYSNKESIYETITKEPKQKLEALITSFKSKFANKNHTFEQHIDFDVFVDAIKQVIKVKSIDYVVMGTNGATGAKEVLLGSNTINVLRKVNCKTLIVPENYAFSPVKALLLPLDPKDVTTSTAFAELLELVESYQLHLHVLRVNPITENVEQEEEDTFNLAITDSKYFIVNNVPMDYAISTYLQVNTIDLMALFVQKEGFFEHFFSNPNTKISISKISKPMFIFHV